VSRHTVPSGPATDGNIFLKESFGMVFNVLVAFFLIASVSSNLFPFKTVFKRGEQPKVTRSHVRGVGWLLNDRNAMTCQKYLDRMCCVCWCIVYIYIRF